MVASSDVESCTGSTIVERRRRLLGAATTKGVGVLQDDVVLFAMRGRRLPTGLGEDGCCDRDRDRWQRGWGRGWRARPTSLDCERGEQVQVRGVVAGHQGQRPGLQTNPMKEETRITKQPEKPLYFDDHEVPEVDFLPLIYQVRAMLRSMNDGEISISAYDTAWVALVPRLDGGDGPQFMTSVNWIINNQLPDNSWGDAALFSAYDRMMNTLACVVALTKWSLEPSKCKKGLSFLEENVWRLTKEDLEPMPVGFEIAFPSLIEAARSLGIEFPYEHNALQSIYYNREVKLNLIPKDLMHNIPTSILYSLEGMLGLDWQKLLKLKSSDGSFLCSPSATAYALMQTGDNKCFEYISMIVKKFNGGVPNVYPVDLFEHLWAVDRLERLGISRYFEREIEYCMDYVKRYWTEEGICWARNSNVADLDDTSMAFRLLRLHGYDVSPSVFKHFEKDGEFFCLVGQSTQAITGMYNMNRAAQISFPGEDILQHARAFSYKYLREREAQGTVCDKWIISKDLPGEVQYTLDFPWYANLPRLEARTYLDQYGGSDDVWIGKTLYRMPLVNNNTYLELARLDFNSCQVLHQLEWHGLQKWFTRSGLKVFQVAPEDVLRTYFLAAASIFEPSRANERFAWTTVSVLANTISTHIRSNFTRKERMVQFLQHGPHEQNDDPSWLKGNTKDDILASALQQLIDTLAQEALPSREGPNYIHNLLRCAWNEWMIEQIYTDDDKYTKSSVMQQGSCVVNGKQTCLLLVKVIEICAGRTGEVQSMINNVHGARFIQHAYIYDNLHQKQLLSQDTDKKQEIIYRIDEEVEFDMQELARYHLQRCDDTTSNRKTKQTFMDVVKTCYYAANCPQHMVDKHVSRVIFEPISSARRYLTGSFCSYCLEKMREATREKPLME
ncbi:ent-copalyl diphosphate synthase AN1, chloroplastic-like [Triticum urartu]|uniref:ent-copalyl diphosphate synthase AN1, chloroplastic-like n=1 Tax=Triticum urartu TaxID=4572 RepID=UPI002043031C|nr:ent-copalyl diphosphate synthase AN1, chloroplastic-like [Triticum urartu]